MAIYLLLIKLVCAAIMSCSAQLYQFNLFICALGLFELASQ